MNIKDQINIGNDILNNIFQFMDKYFLDDLPNSPQKLLKYAKRRVSPFIASYICDSLKNKMLASRMTDEEYLLAFYQIIRMNFINKKREDNPIISIILSQTGGGKTELVKLINKKKNSIVINTDLYKKYNPKYNQIYKEDPIHLAELTAIDSYDLANNIKDFALDNKFSLIFDIAPNKKEIIDIDSKTLIDRGYNIEYHILAVGDLVSSLSIHYRYEKQIKEENYEKIKLTNLNRHDESYRELLNKIKYLPINNTYLYRRGTEKEGFVPQLFKKTNRDSIQKLYFDFIFEIEKSNKLYVLGQGIKNNFLQDYFKIKSLMIKRNATECQFIQLRKIFDRYKNLFNYHIT